MTVGRAGRIEGKLLKVISEWSEHSVEGGDLVREVKIHEGVIHSNLAIGPNLSEAMRLNANSNLCAVGIKTIGSGFVLQNDEALEFRQAQKGNVEKHIRPYINGRDLASTPRDVYVIDFYGMEESEVRNSFPIIYQYLVNTVKPYREVNRNKKFRELWWIIGHPRPIFREFTNGLDRFIATIETSKHRFFVFLPIEIMPDSTLVTFGLEDAYNLGLLSSRIHVTWALATGSRLGVGNDPRYNKTLCFETFPFPEASKEQIEPIRKLGEQLDSHRKRQQSQHPKLTLTDMYNVLEKVRAGEALDDKERRIYDQGLIGILKEIHDELDQAVASAYGWLPDLEDEEILQRLVDLNAERAAEEAQGLVRWLRPEYQAPEEYQQAQQPSLIEIEDETAVPVPPAEKRPWPDTLPERARAVREALAALGAPAAAADVAAAFKGRRTKKRIGETADLLRTLAALGQAEVVDGGRFVVV